VPPCGNGAQPFFRADLREKPRRPLNSNVERPLPFAVSCCFWPNADIVSSDAGLNFDRFALIDRSLQELKHQSLHGGYRSYRSAPSGAVLKTGWSGFKDAQPSAGWAL
jgi:hypothetical protein